MTYQLVGYPLCPFVQRVLITLHEKNIDYELIWLDPHADLPEWFKEWSPLGRVPVMKVPSGEVLFESLAIVDFLEEDHSIPSLYPTRSVQKALTRAWTGIAGELYGPQYMTMRSKTEEEVTQHFVTLKNSLQVLENECHSDTLFFNSRSLSTIDVVLAPMFARFKLVAEVGGENPIVAFPKLTRLSEKLLDYLAVKNTMDHEWKARFIENMKKNESYLFK